MIDTLVIRMNFTDFDTTCLSTKTKIDENGVLLSTSWKLKNLTITINHIENQTYLQGSIKKYYFGEGTLDDFSFYEFKEAIGLIIKDLRLKGDDVIMLYQADVIRLDMGMTIETTNAVSDYIHAIQSRKSIGKDTFSDETVQFVGANKKIIFYDKFKERRKAKIKPQDIMLKGMKVEHDRWLRFEVQWKKISALQSQIYGTRKLIQIFDNYSQLLDRVIIEFKEIHFSKLSSLQVVNQVTNSSDALATALVIAAKGDAEAIEVVNDICNKGLIKKNAAAYGRKKIRECIKNFKMGSHDNRDELLEEVKSRIEGSYHFYKYDILKQSAGDRRKQTIVPTEELPADLGKIFTKGVSNLIL